MYLGKDAVQCRVGVEEGVWMRRDSEFRVSMLHC